jgi:two-component system, OmpR family, response regulator
MSLNRKSIFVVDDDEMMRTMLCDHLLKNPVHQIEAFATGEDCVRNLHRRPDVVILDYQLNSAVSDASDGLEILQKIKKADRNICVIMLSSQTQYGKALQTIVKGALEYVVKDKEAFKRIDGILESL